MSVGKSWISDRREGHVLQVKRLDQPIRNTLIVVSQAKEKRKEFVHLAIRTQPDFSARFLETSSIGRVQQADSWSNSRHYDYSGVLLTSPTMAAKSPCMATLSESLFANIGDIATCS